MSQTNLYTVTIPPMIKGLTALSTILDKAESFAEAHKLSWMSFDEALLNDRIVFTQFPFVRQVQLACDHAKGGAGRLAQVEVPKHEDTEKTFAELKARIAKTLEFVQSIKPEQVIGKEDISVTLAFFPDKYLTGFDYAIEYLMPNFMFHLTTAYSILRKNGMEIGKVDFVGTMPFKELAKA
ncbi:MAG: hypothetical protein JWO50_688 [Candidatus Kaiserbacteria bacterium]|nr:hypothetical protein [Candidatus Kaiserbacteria bacterium]